MYLGGNQPKLNQMKRGKEVQSKLFLHHISNGRGFHQAQSYLAYWVKQIDDPTLIF